MRLNEVCDIERAKEGKIYPAGCTLIQVSATKGDVLFLEEPQSVEASKYAVAIPKIDIEPLYLFTMIEMQMDSFIERYRTGLNVQMDSLKFIDIPEKHIQTQRVIAKFIKLYDLYYKQTELIVQLEKDLKKNMLDSMFVQGD